METIKFIQSFSNDFLDTFFVFFTDLGGQTLGLILTIYFLWFRDKRYGYRLGFTVSLSLLINNMIKIFVNSPRPIGEPGIRTLAESTATGTSFPSGHSQGTSTTFTSLILHKRSKFIIIIGIIMMILIPISRLYLGVHWPKDVIFGTLFGILSVFLADIIFDYVEKTNNLYIFIIISIVSILSIAFLNSEDYIKSVGSLSALCIGYVLDQKYIKYDIKSNSTNPFMKLLIGLPILAILFLGIPEIIPFKPVMYFVKYFASTIWVTAGATGIFNLKSKM